MSEMNNSMIKIMGIEKELLDYLFNYSINNSNTEIKDLFK